MRERWSIVGSDRTQRHVLEDQREGEEVVVEPLSCEDDLRICHKSSDLGEHIPFDGRRVQCSNEEEQQEHHTARYRAEESEAAMFHGGHAKPERSALQGRRHACSHGHGNAWRYLQRPRRTTMSKGHTVRTVSSMQQDRPQLFRDRSNERISCQSGRCLERRTLSRRRACSADSSCP